MYTKRNTITLFLLLTLVVGVGFAWYTGEVKILHKVKTQNTRLARQFHGTEQVVQTLETVELTFADLKENWQHAPKKILSIEEPAFTISYINWLIQNYNLDLNFDFFLNDFNKKDDISTPCIV